MVQEALPQVANKWCLESGRTGQATGQAAAVVQEAKPQGSGE